MEQKLERLTELAKAIDSKEEEEKETKEEVKEEAKEGEKEGEEVKETANGKVKVKGTSREKVQKALKAWML